MAFPSTNSDHSGDKRDRWYSWTGDRLAPNVSSERSRYMRERSPQVPTGSQALLKQHDILIDGPYVASLAINDPTSPISSKNQRVYVFNPALIDRITWASGQRASDQMEVYVLKDGSRIVTRYRSGAGVFE